MDEQKLVPKLRFPGFTDPWEQRKLGEIATFSKGIGYSKSDLNAVGSPIILYGRLYTKYEVVIDNVDTYVIAKPNSVISRKGDVLVPASGETSEEISIASAVEKAGILLGGDLNIIHKSESLDSVFLALSISHGAIHKELIKRAQGKSVVHLHNKDLQQAQMKYPSICEQLQISSCFRIFDNLITLHQEESFLHK